MPSGTNQENHQPRDAFAAALPLRCLANPDVYAAVSFGWWETYSWTRFVLRKIADSVNSTEGRGRIIINAPPRHGKSWMTSRVLPTWFLDHYPERRVLMTTHSKDLALDFGRTVRNEFRSNQNLRTKLREDSKAAGRWHTPEGGGMYCVGVGGGVTGFGGDLIIVDDPYPSWAAAQSYRYRREVQDWFVGTLYNRAEPGATIIVNHTRFHPQDLTGFLAGSHGDSWSLMCFPAIAESNDAMGRAVGESLCPERYDQVELENIRVASGPDVWPATYQQRPRQTYGNAVYHRFTQATAVGSVPLSDSLPLCVTFDFNINPGMHAIIGQHDPRADRFNIAAELHAPRMTVEACMKTLVEWIRKSGGWRWPELHVYGDASGNAKSVTGGESAYTAVRNGLVPLGLTRERLRIRVPAANPRVAERVAAMNDALSDSNDRPHLFVHSSCSRLLLDLGSVQTDDNGGIDKSDPALTHASDAVGYWVHYLRPLRSSTAKASPARIIT